MFRAWAISTPVYWKIHGMKAAKTYGVVLTVTFEINKWKINNVKSELDRRKPCLSTGIEGSEDPELHPPGRLRLAIASSRSPLYPNRATIVLTLSGNIVRHKELILN